MKELNELLLKSFEAHMNWIIPKIKTNIEMIDAVSAKNHILHMLKNKTVNPKEIADLPIWTPYGEKVFDTYKEIYYNNESRFVKGRGTEVTIERIL